MVNPDENASGECDELNGGRKCELCNHMRDGQSFVVSNHFGPSVAVQAV
jgi:hypothetical protein